MYDIFSIRALIADFIHQLLYKMNAKSPDLTRR